MRNAGRPPGPCRHPGRRPTPAGCPPKYETKVSYRPAALQAPLGASEALPRSGRCAWASVGPLRPAAVEAAQAVSSDIHFLRTAWVPAPLECSHLLLES